MDQGVTARVPAAISNDGGESLRPAYIPRFDLGARLAHWLLAVPFVLLMATGLTNFAPRLKAYQVADVRLFAWLHVVLGFVMLGAAVIVLLSLLPRRAVRRDAEELANFGVDDYLWVQHQVLRATGQASRPPPVGKFNAGQRINALISALATVALLGTGLVLGVNYTTKEVFEVDFVEPMFRWHTLLSLLVLPIVLGHIYLAMLHPSTRESLRGITLGVVRRDWAQRHHPAWAPRDGDEPPAR